MKNIATRMLLTACLVLPFAACKKQDEAPAEPAEVALVAPTTTAPTTATAKARGDH